MKRLIVNADDFGFTRGVNRAVVRAFKMGIVTSTTIMANGEAFDDAVKLALANPGLGVGCHLAVVGGLPVAPAADVSSLVDSSGVLPRTLTRLMFKLARGSVPTEELTREFRAQLERVAQAGIKLTHLDTHKHSHTHPRVMKALAKAAAEFGIKCVRNPFENPFLMNRPSPLSDWSCLKQYALSAAISPGVIQFKRLARKNGLKTPDRFFGVRVTGMLDRSAIRSIMESLGEGTAELMCHPGEYDADLERAHTRLKRERERELEALSDPNLRRLAEEQGIELINYRGL
jgi:hopanoid biosynthesis associated protein HpnK